MVDMDEKGASSFARRLLNAAVLPDGFRQNARENCQNARINAPA